ncbi:MAG: cyclic nucleotide-binding domain-containing protein [Desulfobacterales bacterium]|jgi:hypothetical protein|nr:cyclic nucleotide-binding domain-containing protein [Desulfobacterales bacterium]
MQANIPNHIIDGTIAIKTIDAFMSILEAFPGHAHLQRMFAGMLAANGRRQAAAHHFGMAAAGFIRDGKLLSALVSKAQQWQAVRPEREALQQFHRLLDDVNGDGSAGSQLVKRLSHAERMALFARFELICLPSRAAVRTPGQPETALYGLLCGRLTESNYALVEGKPRHRRPPICTLQEGDFFGDVYPFSAERVSQSSAETNSRVELVVLPRRRLIQVCRKHPNIERCILELCRVRFRPGTHRSAALRRGERYVIPAPMRLKIAPAAPQAAPLILTGRSLDLSLSGLTFIPENLSAEILEGLKKVEGRKVQLVLPFQDFSMAVGGRLARVFQVGLNGSKSLAIAVHFTEIPPSQRGAFFAMAGSVAEATGRPTPDCQRFSDQPD